MKVRRLDRNVATVPRQVVIRARNFPTVTTIDGWSDPAYRPSCMIQPRNTKFIVSSRSRARKDDDPRRQGCDSLLMEMGDTERGF